MPYLFWTSEILRNGENTLSPAGVRIPDLGFPDYTCSVAAKRLTPQSDWVSCFESKARCAAHHSLSKGEV